MAKIFETPDVTVDIVLMTIADDELSVVLFEREVSPHKGEPALVGGYVHVQEDADAEAAAERILLAKTGLSNLFIEQLKTFSGRDRDPRGWSVSIAYLALVPMGALEANASKPLIIRPAVNPGKLPFDHNEIVAAACERLRSKGAYSTMPARLLPEPEFTMSELIGIYRIVVGEDIDQSAFRRKMKDLDLLEEVKEKRKPSASVRRPSALYRLRSPVTTFDRRIAQVAD